MKKMDLLKSKFSDHLNSALKQAGLLAQDWNNSVIEPGHILVALAKTEGALASELLIKGSLDVNELEQFLLSNLPSGTGKVKLSLIAQERLLDAALLAHKSAHSYIGTEHLLQAILKKPSLELLSYGKTKNWETSKVKEQLEIILKSGSKLPELTETFTEMRDNVNDEDYANDDLPNLAKTFGTHLTNPEYALQLDPVIGREREIERLMQILTRRTKNNPVLLGDPGVGKTAIVEGLARRIVQGKVPTALEGKKILALDVGSLVAGTMFRGEFENRMRQLIEELKKSEDVIVFIDELHTIVGAGSASGSIDAANLLKPALARGEIRCIGATTIAEYRQHIESDGALERRFQPILVDEPTPNETKQILNGLKANYENHHGVTLEEKALDASILLSERYLPDRFLPDKAIDLIDEAAARVKMKTPVPIELTRIKELQSAEKLAIRRKEDATRKEKFEEAIHWKKEAVNHKIHRLEIEAEIQKKVFNRPAVDQNHIAEILTSWTKVPITELVTSEQTQLKNLHTDLAKHFIGQENVIKTVSETIRRSRLGLSDRRRPLASFLLVGPSGVGKTSLAKSLAKILFGDETALLRFDMTEFSEGFTVSKLIGAPAGYVGYKESGLLTEQIRRRPYQVILFDELDRAHRDVYQILLQILGEGSLRDATGRLINFKQTIIVATANPTNFESNILGFGSGANKEVNEEVGKRLVDSVNNLFPAELRQRFDAILPLTPLTRDNLEAILIREIIMLNERLLNRNIEVTINSEAKNYLLNEVTNNEGGARELQRTLQSVIENELATKLLRRRSNSPKVFTLQRNAKRWILS